MLVYYPLSTKKMFLYLGDDDISRAAAYLSGVLLYHGILFERVDSTDSPPKDFLSKKYSGYIISDYPSKNFRTGEMEQIGKNVADGAGLLMIGGWESFHGKDGEYHRSPLADVLPVNMLPQDDRQNGPQPVMLYADKETQRHPILAGLPWTNPPFIGGYNIFKPKADAALLLTGAVFEFTVDETPNGGHPFRPTMNGLVPMLVAGKHGKGRTAALATDVAPHWAGNFVDWGKNRITQALPNGGFIEVGEHYAAFFFQLVRWIGTEQLLP